MLVFSTLLLVFKWLSFSIVWNILLNKNSSLPLCSSYSPCCILSQCICTCVWMCDLQMYAIHERNAYILIHMHLTQADEKEKTCYSITIFWLRIGLIVLLFIAHKRVFLIIDIIKAFWLNSLWNIFECHIFLINEGYLEPYHKLWSYSSWNISSAGDYILLYIFWLWHIEH